VTVREEAMERSGKTEEPPVREAENSLSFYHSFGANLPEA